MEKLDVFQMFHVFAATHRQRARKDGTECFGPCVLFVHLSLVVYLIPWPWKNNHVVLYFGCWDGEIKKELTVPLKGLSILYSPLCPSPFPGVSLPTNI